MREQKCGSCFHKDACKRIDYCNGEHFIDKSQVKVYATKDEIDQGTRRLDYLCKKLVDLRTKFEKDPDYYIFKEIMEFHKEEDDHMDENDQKEVYFHQYCKKCRHEKVEMTEEPCNECLGHPTNTYSHKPIKYEEK